MGHTVSPALCAVAFIFVSIACSETKMDEIKEQAWKIRTCEGAKSHEAELIEDKESLIMKYEKYYDPFPQPFPDPDYFENWPQEKKEEEFKQIQSRIKYYENRFRNDYLAERDKLCGTTVAARTILEIGTLESMELALYMYVVRDQYEWEKNFEARPWRDDRLLPSW